MFLNPFHPPRLPLLLLRPFSTSPTLSSLMPKPAPKPAADEKEPAPSSPDLPPPSGSDLASQQSAEAIAHKAHVESGLTGHAVRDVVMAELVSGAPAELHHRPVRIYKPTKSTMQSGKAGMNHWRIDFDNLQGSGRWINPLMGWASSADYMQGTSLKFATEEEAVRFCSKQGWEYLVQKPNVHTFKPKTYAENYVHVPGQLRIARTK